MTNYILKNKMENIKKNVELFINRSIKYQTRVEVTVYQDSNIPFTRIAIASLLDKIVDTLFNFPHIYVP